MRLNPLSYALFLLLPTPSLSTPLKRATAPNVVIGFYRATNLLNPGAYFDLSPSDIAGVNKVTVPEDKKGYWNQVVVYGNETDVECVFQGDFENQWMRLNNGDAVNAVGTWQRRADVTRADMPAVEWISPTSPTPVKYVQCAYALDFDWTTKGIDALPPVGAD